MKRHATSGVQFVAFVLLLAMTAGCGKNEEAGPNGTAAAGNQQKAPEEPVTAAPEPAQQTLQIKAYYTDEEQSGLVERTRDISFTEGDVKAKLEAAFKALQTEGASGEYSLWKNVQLLHIATDGKAVTLDIRLPDEARLGAPGEALALEALENTMFQFAEVGSIDVLVDGEKVDSLMGHEELEHPIVKP